MYPLTSIELSSGLKNLNSCGRRIRRRHGSSHHARQGYLVQTLDDVKGSRHYLRRLGLFALIKEETKQPMHSGES
jgi:hypothetical protein